jgi:hypothetical protein
VSIKERHFVLGQCYLTFRIYQQENKNALPETASVRPSVCVIQHLQMCRSSLRAFFTDRCRTARCHRTAHYLPVHVVTFGTGQLPAVQHSHAVPALGTPQFGTDAHRLYSQSHTVSTRHTVLSTLVTSLCTAPCIMHKFLEN